MMKYCNEEPPASCWDVLFEQYKRQNDPEGCLHLLESMYSAIPNHKKYPRITGEKRRFSLVRMFTDYINNEMFDEACSTVAKPIFAVEPSLTHWYHTIHAFAIRKGGRAAYSILCSMREEYNLIPSVECFSCVINELIDEDAPELIGSILRFMNDDGIMLDRETKARMREMRRFDIVLEVMDEIGGLNGRRTTANQP